MTLSGRLKHRITIESLSISRDDSGEEIEGWNTVGTFWAQVLPVSGSERYTSDAIRASRMNTFRMRYQPNIVPTMRIQYAGLTWRILFVNQTDSRQNIIITAEALT